MKKIILGVFGLLSFLIISYFLGPRPEYKMVDLKPVGLSLDIEEVENYIAQSNDKVATLKKDNGAQVYWADSIAQETDYVLLFLHGFSGTHHEANPLHKEFGKRYGMNVYLHRIIDHGVSDPDAFKDITPADFLNSAKEGVQVAKILGKKIVIMSCSTGGTYAAYLAQHDDAISHLIFLSPNFALYDSNAELMTGPWGEALVDQLFGDHRVIKQPSNAAPYWQSEYHTDGIIALQALMDQTMTDEVFSNIEQPTFIGCYYKNEDAQDFVVSVEAMRHFYKTVSTPIEDKVFKEFPNAGNHVIGSPLKAKNTEEVFEAVYEFGDRYFK